MASPGSHHHQVGQLSGSQGDGPCANRLEQRVLLVCMPGIYSPAKLVRLQQKWAVGSMQQEALS